MLPPFVEQQVLEPKTHAMQRQICSVSIAQSIQPDRLRDGESRASSSADLIAYENATVIRKASKPAVKRRIPQRRKK
jgi:hypothetical protein